MKTFTSGVLALVLVGFGCASPEINPAAPKAKTAYVDVYASAPDSPAWEIRQWMPAANEFKTVFSSVQPVERRALRLAFSPGEQKLRITVLNRVVSEPALLEVKLVEGRITPIAVQFTAAGSTLVETREQRRGATYKGRYGRNTVFGVEESKTWRVVASAREPIPYKPLEQMSYP